MCTPTASLSHLCEVRPVCTLLRSTESKAPVFRVETSLNLGCGLRSLLARVVFGMFFYLLSACGRVAHSDVTSAEKESCPRFRGSFSSL